MFAVLLVHSIEIKFITKIAGITVLLLTPSEQFNIPIKSALQTSEEEITLLDPDQIADYYKSQVQDSKAYTDKTRSPHAPPYNHHVDPPLRCY